jgi:DNA polymerase-3 subunit gamma/tau
VLRLLDKAITDGQNPAHFARQLVRFLRNAIVAKVSGADSPLLQISSDERARVARIAEQFSEEDLTRFLQILLRTHNDLSYKQEQRFHLELGLMKLVHAQRLLPIEELLSQVPPKVERTPSTTLPASRMPSSAQQRPGPVSSTRTVEPSGPSPFERDRMRKGSGPKAEMSAESSSVAVREADIPAGDLAGRVLQELEGKHGMLAHHLEQGEWKVAEAEVVVHTAASLRMLEMLLVPEARKLINAAASAALGRGVKVQVIGGASNGNSALSQAPSRPGRTRAAEDPVVRRMQEKFGAEIRTVIDHKEKQR